jgi:glycosyltransferase involved in cell wall biosynthesis
MAGRQRMPVPGTARRMIPLQRAEQIAPLAGASAVLVSVIVRSMGRPELRATLESIARQDHPSIEVVIVDATGGHHPPLPNLRWREGHAVRVVSGGKPLKRPQAAMLGLQSVRGDWLMFLDDDDTCEPTHVSALLDAASRHPGALVVYGCGRLCDGAGRVLQVFGRPFNRALMHYGPLFYWQSAIISTRVRDLGCGFDAALDVCEDRDFLAQIAEQGDFVFVPSLATFNYRPDLGTSGTGQGANRNAARVARYENLLRAKWAGSGIYHNERAANLCRNGVRDFFRGDL